MFTAGSLRHRVVVVLSSVTRMMNSSCCLLIAHGHPGFLASARLPVSAKWSLSLWTTERITASCLVTFHMATPSSSCAITQPLIASLSHSLIASEAELRKPQKCSHKYTAVQQNWLSCAQNYNLQVHYIFCSIKFCCASQILITHCQIFLIIVFLLLEGDRAE